MQQVLIEAILHKIKIKIKKEVHQYINQTKRTEQPKICLKLQTRIK